MTALVLLAVPVIAFALIALDGFQGGVDTEVVVIMKR